MNIIVQEARQDFSNKMASKQDAIVTFAALMGRGDGLDPRVAGREGYVWVRVGHAQSLQMAYNTCIMPYDDLAIYVGYKPEQPNLLQVISVRQEEYVNTGQGVLPVVQDHHQTHEWAGGDDVWVSYRRLVELHLGQPAAFTVYLNPGVLYRSGAYEWIAAQNMDLSAHKPVLGLQARYVLMYIDAAGVLQARDGTIMGTPALLDVDDIPSPLPGEYAVAGVRLYNGQTAISDLPTVRDIVELRGEQPFSISGPHNILSATHGDSLTAAVVDGDIIIGNVTPAWSRLGITIPGAGTLNYLGVNNAELRPSWKSASAAPGVAASVLQSNATGGLTLSGLLSYDRADWTGGNVIYVAKGDGVADEVEINAAIAAAAAGDTLVLAAGQHVIAASIVVTKQLNIVGQGNAGFFTAPLTPGHGTLIQSAVAGIVAFQINADNVRIASLSINLTGNASTGVNTANNLTGLVFHNIDVIVTCAGLAQGFTVYGSNIVMRNLSFYITSTNTAASGVWLWNDSNTTQNAIADCFNVTGTVVGAGTYAYGYVCENLNDANTLTLNLESCTVRALNGTPLDVAVASISTTTSNSTVNCYLCTLDGANYDAYQNNANVLALGGSVLVNGTTFGTVTYRATMAAGTAVLGGTLTLATGSITDSSGAISFGDEDLTFNLVTYTWPAADAAGVLTSNGAGVLSWGAAGGVHNLLSATHSDTVVNGATRGSLIYGNSTPAWDELVLGGASGSFLTRDATDVVWSGFYLAGTAGQTYTFPAVGGTIPTGTGTNTYVTYWTGTNSIAGSANLTWDATRLMAQIADAATNTAVYPLRVSHITSGTAAANFGVGVEFQNEDAAGTAIITGKISSLWIDAAAVKQESRLEVRGSVSNGFGGITNCLLGVICSPLQVDGAGMTDGNARGAGAIDLQTYRVNATEVAVGDYSTIVGGHQNTAGGNEATVVGGVGNSAAGQFSVVVGGYTNEAEANYSVVVGGELNDIAATAFYSAAMGRRSHIGLGHTGVFMFSDSTDADFNSVMADEAAFRVDWIRNAYDDSYYSTWAVASDGDTTFDIVHAAGTPTFTFTHTVIMSTLTASTVIYSDASKQIVSLANAAGVLTNNGAGVLSWGAAAAHALLSATHNDTVANGPTRGSLIYGNSTPAWDELVLGGASGSFLTRNATDVAWSGFYFSGTAGGTTNFAVTNTKTLTLTATDSYNLTIPATGTAALLSRANIFTAAQTVNLNAAALPAGPAGTIVQIASADATNTRFLGDAFAATNNFVFRRANNTCAVPQALAALDQIGSINAFGYGATGYTTTGRATIGFHTSQAWTDANQGTYIDFFTTPNNSVTNTDSWRMDQDGALLPMRTTKTQNIGAAGSRINTLYLGTSTAAGTSRLVRSMRLCPVCKTEMVRGTGSLCILGETADYEVAQCPKCGVLATEEMKHLPDSQKANRRPAPQIKFVGFHVFEMSGNSRKVRVDFDYGNDVKNSTYLGETELAELLTMTEKQRQTFLRQLGQREWDALEETRLMQETCAILQSELDAIGAQFAGKDL